MLGELEPAVGSVTWWKRAGSFLAHLPQREVWYYFGPAFVASVAYIDPGNFATNIEGGSRFHYQLLWVLLWSNLMAILVQFLSAKLGIVTGRTLPQNCRAHFARPTNVALWVAAEIAAMATDLAEFLGAALGFYLLFGIPLLQSALLTGAVVFAILAVERLGFRKFEYLIMAFVGVIGGSYAVEVFLARPNWGQIAHHTLIPHLSSDSIYVAVGMLGATVMPHVVYLHSALVQHRVVNGDPRHNHRHSRMELIDVLVAMNGAWLINSAMIIMSAAVFYRHGLPVASIEQAHHTLKPLLGEFSSVVFAVALLCSGLSSATVGTMAGQVILEGFMNFRISIFTRRLITMVPAIAVIALGLEPLRILILSQVCLSFCLPFAIVPLIWLTGKHAIMGSHANRPWTQWLAILCAAVILALNGLLLVRAFGGKF